MRKNSFGTLLIKIYLTKADPKTVILDGPVVVCDQEKPGGEHTKHLNSGEGTRIREKHGWGDVKEQIINAVAETKYKIYEEPKKK